MGVVHVNNERHSDPRESKERIIDYSIIKKENLEVERWLIVDKYGDTYVRYLDQNGKEWFGAE
jgi:hypothetical protein